MNAQAVYVTLTEPTLLVVRNAVTQAEIGRARRTRRRWHIVVGPHDRRAWCFRSAVRKLERLGMDVLTAGAIGRARLDTYRPDREDRHTGWHA